MIDRGKALQIDALDDMIGRVPEWTALSEFATSGAPEATLGIVRGRRRVGKSFLLHSLTQQTGGFRFEAVRGAPAEALRAVGEAIGVSKGRQHRAALMRLGAERETVVVLDEFPYLLELASIIQRAFGPRSPLRTQSRTRLILCGSATTVMGNLLGGSAPLRGRAGLDLRISPFDFRAARTALGARAAGARLLLFGSAFDDEVQRVAAERADVELVDLGRMYGG